MKRNFLTFSLCAFVFTSQAQQKESNPPQLKFNWSNKFNLVDDEGLPVKSRMKRQEMYELLADYPAGKDLYDQFQKANTLGKVFSWAGVGTAVTGLGCIVGSIDFDGGGIKNDGLFWTGIGLEGATIVLEGLGIGFTISAKTKGYKLSNAYNKHQDKYSFNFGGTKHGIGLTVNF